MLGKILYGIGTFQVTSLAWQESLIWVAAKNFALSQEVINAQQ